MLPLISSPSCAAVEATHTVVDSNGHTGHDLGSCVSSKDLLLRGLRRRAMLAGPTNPKTAGQEIQAGHEEDRPQDKTAVEDILAKAENSG
ncbi:hypothetical protein MOV61_01505 [Neorhizobium sp. BETTINA12A]|uniref:hypothetical protein n=1 Tax=Neorhizobium sp. BETTINA12A TaxID=2908924 RepID=UPI001FF2F543|nr:hypothetical protein [Neorhizobium sp. BETTINA12A]MCJ9749390.1 hypothetical protein [Neorhizobium sp. BETTINA12A]